MIDIAIDELEGQTLEGGWEIKKLVSRKPWQTGGCFSVGYIVSHPDKGDAFLKVFDFTEAFRMEDPTKALEKMLNAYNFERDVLKLCNGSNLDKVVIALDNGAVRSTKATFQPIHYLIFELAECDARVQMREAKILDVPWCMRVLHQVAVGLQQLHNKGIFHQDLKPSNILLFNQRRETKLADFGRAHCGQLNSPFDQERIPGALSHAPLEQLYSYQIDNTDYRRRSADMYHFANMIFFMFTGASLTASLVQKLRDEHRPPLHGPGWRGFYHDVLPFIRDAFEHCVDEFRQEIAQAVPGPLGLDISQQLAVLLRYAGEPDPLLRGHPSSRRNKFGNPYFMDRFVSAFALLAKKVELKIA